MSKDTICKEGIVKGTHDGFVDVQIVISSACSGCHAKSVCMPSDQKQEVVAAKSLYGESFEIGEKVQLILKNASGTKAVVIAYVIPFVILIAALVGGFLLTHNELLAVIISIAFVAIYYLCLTRYNKRLEQDFTFFVKKIFE